MAATANVRFAGQLFRVVSGLTEQRMDVVAQKLSCEIRGDDEWRLPGGIFEGKSMLEALNAPSIHQRWQYKSPIIAPARHTASRRLLIRARTSR
jgi:hypothetical protein